MLRGCAEAATSEAAGEPGEIMGECENSSATGYPHSKAIMDLDGHRAGFFVD